MALSNSELRGSLIYELLALCRTELLGSFWTELHDSFEV